jgi:hypothetical protein
MQIQVNSDKSVVVDAGLILSVQERVSDVLDRFSDQITRVEVHLSDVDGERSGAHDKRCLLEARVSGRDPVAVTNQAPSPEEAASGAALKMQRLLSSMFGRQGDKS